MVLSVRCQCGAEYVVDESAALPGKCRFCGNRAFVRSSPSGGGSTGTAPPPSWQRRGPTYLDRMEIEHYGGSKEVLWGGLVIFSYLLPRVVGDSAPEAAWELVVAAAGDLPGMIKAVLPAAAGAGGILLGLLAPGRFRGPVLFLLAGAALLTGLLPREGVAEPGLLQIGTLLALGLAGGLAALVRAPDGVTARILVLLLGFAWLILHALVVFGVMGRFPFPGEDLPLAVSLAAGGAAGAASLFAIGRGPLGGRAARACRFALWLALLAWAAGRIVSPISGDAFYELGPVFMLAGVFGVAATALADGLLAASAAWRERVGGSLAASTPGFLERFHPDAKFGSGRDRR